MVSQSSYTRFQTTYLVPAVEKFSNDHIENILERKRGDDIVFYFIKSKQSSAFTSSTDCYPIKRVWEMINAPQNHQSLHHLMAVREVGLMINGLKDSTRSLLRLSKENLRTFNNAFKRTLRKIISDEMEKEVFYLTPQNVKENY